MADLKLLTERVIEKEKAAVQTKVSEAKTTSEERLAKAKRNAEQLKKERMSEIDAQLQNDYEISRNTLAVKKRNDILATKQHILSNVFTEAHTVMANANSNVFQKFLTGVIKQFEGEDQLEIILGELSKDKIPSEWLGTQSIKGTTITISDETIKGKAGLIIRKEGIEYNFLFDALLGDARSELVPVVSQKLFR